MYGLLAQDELTQLKILIEKMIETNSEKDIESTAYTTIENQIKYFYALNENEKIKQEARETEIKYNTQREIFTNLNHSIKNLVGSVSKTLSRTKEEHELSTQVRRLINRASLGANLISAIANAISYSYRDDGDKWKEDLNPTYAAESLPRIIQCALFHAVPNILSGENIRLYSYEYNSYFPTQQEQEQAEVLWYQAYSDELKLNWINQNLFPMKFNIDQSVQSLRIGDKYSTFTHFFIFFNEIFLNTIKAVANVEKMLRKCDINIRVINHCISFELKNSSCSNQIQEKNGFGHIIIENYCKKFEIKDFKETYDTEGKMYQLHFQLPIILKEGEK